MRALIVLPLLIVAVLAGCAESSDPAPDASDQDPSVPGPRAVTGLGFPEGMKWERLNDAQIPRAEHWAAVVDGKVYVIGGYLVLTPLWETQPPTPVAGGPFNPIATVEVYDPATDTWSFGVDYPGPVDHHPTIAYDGVIYVFRQPTGSGAGSYYKFDPKVGEWEPFAVSPHDHFGGTVGIIGDKIYLAGNSNFVDVYDPATDTYESFEGNDAFPTIRNHASGGAVGGRLYLAGGDTAGHSVNTDANEEFDPVAGNWSAKAPVPVMRGSTAGTIWRDHIVVVGGQDGGTGVPAYANVDAYDPATDTWIALPDMPVGRHGAAVAVVDDALYVFAGAPLQGVYGFAQVHVLRAA